MNELIYQWSNKIGTEIIEMRRHFHKYPELGYQEYETAEYIKKKLLKYGIHFKAELLRQAF